MKIYHLALVLLLYPFSSPITHKSVASNIILKSSDGGQTWQDISEGLPENMQGDGFITNDSGLYLRAGAGMYRSKPNSTAPFWKEEVFPDKNSSIARCNAGIVSYNWNGEFFQKKFGINAWSAVYTDSHVTEIRNVHETGSGAIFICSDKGLFKSVDHGKNWRQVRTGGWIMKMAELNGVLMATSIYGIIRSTDDGENWECVLNEGGVGIDIEPIKGGFAAITANTQLKARTVRASYDNGKTWQAIDAGLPAELRTASIIEDGNYFFCGHPLGIYRSSDKGKTWKLILPSIDDKVFNLFVSDGVIYAIPRTGGC